MEKLYEILSDAANLLDTAQNKAREYDIYSIKTNEKLYQLRCDLEDIREDVEEKIN